jgi:hypothetical protein
MLAIVAQLCSELGVVASSHKAASVAACCHGSCHG